MKLVNERMRQFITEYHEKEGMATVVFDGRSDEEIERIYNIYSNRYNNKEDFLNSDGSVCKIEIKDEDIKTLRKFMLDSGMFTVYNRNINYMAEGKVLYYIPKKQLKIIQKFFDVKVIKEEKVVTRSVLNSFKKKQKVAVGVYSVFGNQAVKGTVYDVLGDGIIIRKYRCSRQAVHVKLLELANIKLIDKFWIKQLTSYLNSV